MRYKDNKAENVKIAYIGGGSRGWAWSLMSDLVSCDKMSGDVYLYDIDIDSARKNEVIGNKFNSAEGAVSVWNYHTAEKIEDALIGADFVVISIMPGTFDEMESDVHLPEQYGIYQSVGDTAGPGGIIRALRTLPMMEDIALKVKECCPEAWVINYTNPMTLCVKALYYTFPEIKAFGCCHEVFGTQSLLCDALEDIKGIKDVKREEIKVNVVSVNHFTWLTEAKYKDTDLFPVYAEFCEKYKDTGFNKDSSKKWDEEGSNVWAHRNKVKIDLFRRYGLIAAAGDRHLAEFCPGNWFLKNPEQVVNEHFFHLTPVSYRKENLIERLERSEKLYTGEEEVKITPSGEEGVNQMCALLGLSDLITNVNIPNKGQIPNLPIGAVVETNAVFRDNSLVPVLAGEIPSQIYPLVSRVCGVQEMVAEAIEKRDLELAFLAFCSDPLVNISTCEARKLFDKMIENTKHYLKMYFDK